MIVANAEHSEALRDQPLVNVAHGNARLYFASSWKDKVDEKKFLEVFAEGLNGSTSTASTHSSLAEEDGYGRGEVKRFFAKDGTELVLRVFRRGGLVRHFSDTTFVTHFGETRPLSELAILRYLREQNVKVPEPVAAVIEKKVGGLFYHAAIVMKAIPNARNVLQLAKEVGKDRSCLQDFSQACHGVGVLANKILMCGVYHPDLHLGNAMLDEDNKVWLIDFDKARRFVPNRDGNGYAARTVARWLRSLDKRFASSAPLKRIASEEFLRGFSRT